MKSKPENIRLNTGSRRDPRVLNHDPASRPELPDWKALNVPVLHLSDFIRIPDPFIKAYIVARKARRQIYMRLLRRTDMISKIYDFRLCLPLKDGIGPDLARHGTRELDHRYLIQKLLKPNSIVLDIGANIGYYVTMYGKLMNNSGFIYAVEPDLRSIEYLCRNIALNGMADIVTIDEIAISDYDGTAAFHLASGYFNLSGLEVSNIPRSYDKTVEVPVRDLANYLGSLPHTIDIMRMDIEGHEVAALRSLANRAEKEKSIQWAPKRVLFEGHAWEYHRSGRNEMRPVIERLFRAGYHARYLCNTLEHFSPIRPRGYTPEVVIDDNLRYYGIYENVKNEDAAELISEEPGVTTICLERDDL